MIASVGGTKQNRVRMWTIMKVTGVLGVVDGEIMVIVLEGEGWKGGMKSAQSVKRGSVLFFFSCCNPFEQVKCYQTARV